MASETAGISKGFQYPEGGKLSFDPKSKLKKVPPQFPYYDIDLTQMPKELMDWQPHVQEGFRDRFIRKTKENPFVPVGMVLTVCALSLGLRSFWRGESRRSNFFMKMRVSAQGFTVAAFLGGVFYERYKYNKTTSYPGEKEVKSE